MHEVVLQFDELLQRAGGDHSLAFEVLEDFARMLPEIRQGLRNPASDANVVRRLAHRLKGALLAIGAKPAAEVARELEHGSADAARVPGLNDELDAAVEAVLAAACEKRVAHEIARAKRS